MLPAPTFGQIDAWTNIFVCKENVIYLSKQIFRKDILTRSYF